jgi:hypothetical protein
MAPPFIIYYGALQGSRERQQMMQTAYDPRRLYHSALADKSGLWKPVVLGTRQDSNIWATGIIISVDK